MRLKIPPLPPRIIHVLDHDSLPPRTHIVAIGEVAREVVPGHALFALGVPVRGALGVVRARYGDVHCGVDFGADADPEAVADVVVLEAGEVSTTVGCDEGLRLTVMVQAFDEFEGLSELLVCRRW